ncbi:MAG TPA: hypothetical protein VMS22_06675 [Candidatus Eisenbacteria bacterium]|nr:hypothetical protein [Candidatus Eisenbacteria bacterium]
MPGMPDLILRAPVFHRLAKASRLAGASSNPLVDEIITRLNGDPSQPANKIPQIMQDMGFYADAPAAEHFRRDWLNDPPGGGFWQTIDTESIIRKGIAVALEKFKDVGKPLEFFWVISGDQTTSRWEMTVTVCKRVIVVMFHTPQFPCFVPTKASTSMTVIRPEGGAIIARPVLEPNPPAPAGAAAAKKKPKTKHKKKTKHPKGPKKNKK